MRKFFNALFLFCFAFGVSAMTKYYGMSQWIENRPWVAFPMIVFGGVGILIFFGKED